MLTLTPWSVPLGLPASSGGAQQRRVLPQHFQQGVLYGIPEDGRGDTSAGRPWRYVGGGTFECHGRREQVESEGNKEEDKLRTRLGGEKKNSALDLAV